MSVKLFGEDTFFPETVFERGWVLYSQAGMLCVLSSAVNGTHSVPYRALLCPSYDDDEE